MKDFWILIEKKKNFKEMISTLAEKSNREVKDVERLISKRIEDYVRKKIIIWSEVV